MLIEISAFFVNILQLMLILAKALKPCGGGSCCNDRIEVLLHVSHADDPENMIRSIEDIV